MSVVVEQALVAEVLELRHRVLRPGLPPATAHFDGDELPLTRHWTARARERVVGVASVMPTPDGPAPWQLRGMACEPRGTGSGRLLLERVHADVSAPMWCNARVTAVPFYLRLGWKIDGPEFDIPGVGPHHRMSWSPPAR